MLGGLNIYHNLTLVRKKLAIKKNFQYFWKSIESGLLCRVSKQIYCQTLSAFFTFLKAPGDKLVPHSLISFKNWLHNEESE